MVWKEFHGGYEHSGKYNDVILGGAPGTNGPFGINLSRAHSEGYGKGIQFTANGFLVKFELDLVAYAVTPAGAYAGDSRYVAKADGDYRYIITIWTSNNNQTSWNQLEHRQIFSHYNRATLCYRAGWIDTAKASQWSRDYQIPEDTTHVKIKLSGEADTFPKEVVYKIDEVIPNYRPMAIRKNNTFKSLDNQGGFLKIRKGQTWKEIDAMQKSEEGQINRGSSRVRKNQTWVGQSKIGN